jgi:tellurite resistance protein TerC
MLSTLASPPTLAVSVAPGVDELAASPLAWVLLVAFIVAVLLVDLFVVHRDAHVIGFREAAASSAVYVALGLAFGVVVWAYMGAEASATYYAGFLIEKSLSIDNVFVWAVIFSFFATPAQFQHRVLFWGVFGALVLRAIFIVVGAALLERFDWMVFLFGALLVVTAVQLVRHRGAHGIDLESNRIMLWVRRAVPTTSEYHGQRFWVRQAGVRVATPLMLVLVAVELTDLIFAIDSVPAILALTTNTFIVFAANAFALLGLRALYFLLAGLVARFAYLDLGLAVLLGWVAAKMFYQGATDEKVPIAISLPVIALVLATAIGASLLATRGAARQPLPGVEEDDAEEREDARIAVGHGSGDEQHPS